jgi:hypothetical protein
MQPKEEALFSRVKAISIFRSQKHNVNVMHMNIATQPNMVRSELIA